MSDEEQVTTPVEERDDIDHTEFTSDTNECPDCGEPVDNIRKTCIKCGREYEKDDYDDTEAGNEMRAGTAIDDEGNEITEAGEETGGDDDESDAGESAEEGEAEERGS